MICDNLPCPLLLRSNYMDQHIWDLMPILQEIELASGVIVKIMSKRIDKDCMPSLTKHLVMEVKKKRQRDRKDACLD